MCIEIQVRGNESQNHDASVTDFLCLSRQRGHIPAAPSGGAIFMGYGGTWAVSGPPSLHGQVKGIRSWLQANLMNLQSSSWVNISNALQKNSMCWSVSIKPTWYMVCAYEKRKQDVHCCLLLPSSIFPTYMSKARRGGQLHLSLKFSCLFRSSRKSSRARVVCLPGSARCLLFNVQDWGSSVLLQTQNSANTHGWAYSTTSHTRERFFLWRNSYDNEMKVFRTRSWVLQINFRFSETIHNSK